MTETISSTWNAEDYAQHSSGQYALAQELIGKLAIEPHHHLLDIGCGDGKITRLLAELACDGKVIGIDQSESMIAFARQAHPRENLQFHCMDATSIRLPQSFDSVFSNATLHWVHDQQSVLTGIRRSLKPEGCVLLQFGGEGNASELIAVIQSVQQSDLWRRYFQSFQFPYLFPSVDEYRQWLQDAGFQIDRIALLDRAMDYETRDQFLGWLRTAWFPMVAPIPLQDRSAFWETVCETLLGNLRSISISMKRLEVRATIR